MRKLIVIVLLAGLVMTSGCKIYSFTGADVDPAIKTMSISYINNDSNGGPASVSDLFTQALKDKMLNNTNVQFVNNNGDVQFSGAITRYNYTIQAPTSTTSSDLRRLSIQVRISYDNLVTPEDSWEETFDRFAEFSVDESLDAIEDQLISEINDLLVDDIFNKAFVKW